MADTQRIHPVHDVDVEAQQRQTAPLVPRNSSKSDRGDPSLLSSPPPPQSSSSYPPFRRDIPVMYSKPPKKRSCCCRFFCWTISLLLILIIAIAAAAGILYLVFKPKLPDYSIDSLRITQWNLNNNMSLYAAFNVNLTAENPNKKIGIYYESGSHITVWYTDTQLCEGSLPKFYQGHQNTTVLDLTLTGQTQNATDILTSLQAQQQTGTIPLKLKAKVPVRIKLGKLKLFQVKFRVRCKLDVDSLEANNSIRIKNSSCKFRLRL